MFLKYNRTQPLRKVPAHLVSIRIPSYCDANYMCVSIGVRAFRTAFDDRIDKPAMTSTKLLVSTSKKGCHTVASYLDTLKMLDKQELTALDTPRHVVLRTDGHVSRNGERVLQFCRDNGIRPLKEKSQSSHIFQALDKGNTKYHEDATRRQRRTTSLSSPRDGGCRWARFT